MDRSKIKVVKKAEVARVKPGRRKPMNSRKAAREIVSNVTGWVSELKERKSRETRAAFDMLFATNQRPSES